MTAIEATDNPSGSRYEMIVDGEIAFVDYKPDCNRRILRHTEVPRALAGRGVGMMLVRSVLQDARRRALTIVPECEFIAAFIARHPEFADVVADSGRAP